MLGLLIGAALGAVQEGQRRKVEAPAAREES
jgi:hypothetical protein